MAWSPVPRWLGSVAIDGKPWVIASWSVDDDWPTGARRKWVIDVLDDEMSEETIVIEMRGHPIDARGHYLATWSPDGPVATVRTLGMEWCVRDWRFSVDDDTRRHRIEMDAVDRGGRRVSSIMEITTPTPSA